MTDRNPNRNEMLKTPASSHWDGRCLQLTYTSGMVILLCTSD